MSMSSILNQFGLLLKVMDMEKNRRKKKFVVRWLKAGCDVNLCSLSFWWKMLLSVFDLTSLLYSVVLQYALSILKNVFAVQIDVRNWRALNRRANANKSERDKQPYHVLNIKNARCDLPKGVPYNRLIEQKHNIKGIEWNKKNLPD